jgi:hypothetical protein
MSNQPQPPTEPAPGTQTVTRVVTTTTVPAPEKRRPGFFSRLIQVIFAPITWIVRPLVFRIGNERGNPKVMFTSFSTLLYLWPIMVVGVVNSLLLDWKITSDVELLGWIWITVAMLVLICVGSDLDRNKTIVITFLIVIFWLGGALLDARMKIPVLSRIYNFFDSQNVQFDPGTGKVMSIITFIILVGVVFVAWFDGRYEITTREITHRRVLFTSDSLPRAAARVKRDWRDLTEVLFGLGAGDLIVIDANKNIVMRIPNIPFLWFFRQDVDHILEVLATTDVDDEAAAIAAAEDA